MKHYLHFTLRYGVICDINVLDKRIFDIYGEILTVLVFIIIWEEESLVKKHSGK